MAQEDRLNVRVPADLVRRLDALIPKVTHLPECALLGTLDRSKVVRVALLRGVAVLEAAATEGAHTANKRRERRST